MQILEVDANVKIFTFRPTEENQFTTLKNNKIFHDEIFSIINTAFIHIHISFFGERVEIPMTKKSDTKTEHERNQKVAAYIRIGNVL